MEEVKENVKPSCEELENMVTNLYEKLQEANMYNLFKRLDYLFKVIKYKESFNEGFVSKCISEVEDIMSIPEKTEE